MAIVAALIVPLAVASMAFACARLATLKLDKSRGTPGTEVGAQGRNFNSDANSSPVALRLNSRRGPVLWEGRPGRQGRFTASFTVPRTGAGHYVILATQETQEGRPAPGTPARHPFRVRRARASSSSSAAPVAASTPSGGGGGGLPASPALLVPALLLAAGAGASLVVAGRRRGARAAAQL